MLSSGPGVTQGDQGPEVSSGPCERLKLEKPDQHQGSSVSLSRSPSLRRCFIPLLLGLKTLTELGHLTVLRLVCPQFKPQQTDKCLCILNLHSREREHGWSSLGRVCTLVQSPGRGVGRLRAEAHRSSSLNGVASPVNGGSRNTLLREGSLWAEQILQRVGFCG